VTDVPRCQAAKDVLADAAAWPACQAPGLQAAGERGTQGRRKEGRAGGKQINKQKSRRSSDGKNMARRVCVKQAQVCEERATLRGRRGVI